MFDGGQRVYAVWNGVKTYGTVIAGDDPRVAGWGYCENGKGVWVRMDDRAAPYYIPIADLTAAPVIGY